MRKVEVRCIHFANLLSHRSVNDSFNRKLTTIEVRKIELKGNDWRYTDGR